MIKSLFVTSLCVVVFVLLAAPNAGALEIFATGFDIPETISIAPSGFGDLAGHLFVPDPGPAPVVAGNSKIWTVPPEGGTAQLFADLEDLNSGFELGFRGGLFLPDDFGALGGQYVITGVLGIPAFDSDGDASVLSGTDDLVVDGFEIRRLSTPVIAPADFGDFGGQLLISYQAVLGFGSFAFDGGVIAVTPDGLAEHVADIQSPFGLEFAPTGFGNVGGTLLVSDRVGGSIVSVDGSGAVSPFANIPLLPGQTGLRQMAVAPDGFGELGGLLFVSVAASEQGGGALGTVYALDETGNIRAALDVGAQFNAFDPRGMLFRDAGDLLISDAIGRIVSATPDDLRVVSRSLQAGDADQDLDFDQSDLILVQAAAKYRSGLTATWGEGDWDGAPGGRPGSPPPGNGRFDQFDLVAAFSEAIYLTGPYGSLNPSGRESDGQTSVGYDANTGEIWVDPPLEKELTSINIESASGIFTGAAAENLGGSFDVDGDGAIFKATFGSSFGSLTFGEVAASGLSEEYVVNDLSVIGSLHGGGALSDVDLIYVPIPEPTSLLLLAVGMLVVALRTGRRLPENGDVLNRCRAVGFPVGRSP